MTNPPSPVRIEQDGAIARLTFCRPEKRNAINDATLAALKSFFTAPGEDVRCIIISGEGGHFSAGLDLSEHVVRTPEAVFAHSRGWHQVMELMRLSGLPIVSVLTGAVMGGGLELAAVTHVRIAESGVKFRMPEGKRGIFVGGGGSVNIARIIGSDRMTEMMLTGRTYGAEEGRQFGLAHYAVGEGEGLALAQELAAEIATNATGINRTIITALSRIGDMPRAEGLYTESLNAAMSQTSDDAAEGLKAFLEKRAPNFR